MPRGNFPPAEMAIQLPVLPTALVQARQAVAERLWRRVTPSELDSIKLVVTELVDATSSRCHRSNVCGVTQKLDHRFLGNKRLAAARKLRSRSQIRASYLATQDAQLMAKNDDLEVPGVDRVGLGEQLQEARSIT